MRDALAAFNEECAAFAEHVAGIEGFAIVTNCPPWTLHELIVHVAFSIRMLDHFEPAPTDAPVKGAADYFRRPERNTAPYRSDNVDRAQQIAAGVSAGTAPALFREVWQRTSAVFDALPPDAPIVAGGICLTVDDYLLTRLVSVAAHGVDVAITLERDAWTANAALRCLRPVFVDLLGDQPPTHWSDQDLLECGTGRRLLASADVDALGELADRFPLLS